MMMTSLKINVSSFRMLKMALVEFGLPFEIGLRWLLRLIHFRIVVAIKKEADVESVESEEFVDVGM